MRNIYDQYAKDTLRALLTPVGPVDLEKEVRPEAQRVDLFFTPARERIAKLTLLGLLGRLTRRPCSLEHFHNSATGNHLGSFCRCRLLGRQKLKA